MKTCDICLKEKEDDKFTKGKCKTCFRRLKRQKASQKKMEKMRNESPHTALIRDLYPKFLNSIGNRKYDGAFLNIVFYDICRESGVVLKPMSGFRYLVSEDGGTQYVKTFWFEFLNEIYDVDGNMSGIKTNLMQKLPPDVNPGKLRGINFDGITFEVLRKVIYGKVAKQGLLWKKVITKKLSTTLEDFTTLPEQEDETSNFLNQEILDRDGEKLVL